ncbi:unnamed protein product [Amoebophrya sp. A25]|nr:unnamed protein product [Amoebophrya sp. A25]|eukprot:GSA25T00013425001.1
MALGNDDIGQIHEDEHTGKNIDILILSLISSLPV